MHLGVLATLTLAGSYLSLSLPVCISVWFLSFIDLCPCEVREQPGNQNEPYIFFPFKAHNLEF